jgi:plasmid maintenance system antidote protein VapI
MLSSDYTRFIMDFMAIQDELRKAVREDGRTMLAVAEAAGIHRTTFSAFMNQRRGLSVETIEDLARALKFEIKLVKVKG